MAKNSDIPDVLEGQISLEDYLDQLDGPNPETGEDINPDLDMAARLMRELAKLEKAIDANAQRAAAERAKITSWETTVNEPLQNRAVWLRTQLEGFALHEREKSGMKTFSMPYGEIATTQKGAQWDIGPEFVEWAKAAAPQLLRTKYEPEVAKIKATFEAAEREAVDKDLGTIVPGISITPPTITAKVKPAL
jgi:Bacteriophage Mu Gam like protein